MSSLVKGATMDTRLEELARRLQANRRKTNKVTLDYVMESARILAEAKTLAGRGFSRWVREQAHMDSDTARYHLKVAGFVRANTELIREISTLSMAKIYKLSTLDSTLARALLTGRERLSEPLPQLSDVQFRKEFRDRFPGSPRRIHRGHMYRSALSVLARTEKTLHRAMTYARQMTQAQRGRILQKVLAISNLLARWGVVA